MQGRLIQQTMQTITMRCHRETKQPGMSHAVSAVMLCRLESKQAAHPWCMDQSNAKASQHN
jgi:hypothetical protein